MSSQSLKAACPAGVMRFNLLLTFILAGCLALIGCTAGSSKADADKAASGTPKKEAKKHAGIYGLRSMDLYVQGDVVDVLLADGQMGSEVPELRHSRSRDGGETWSDFDTVNVGKVLPSNPHRGMDAQIVARGDQLVAFWTGPGESKTWERVHSDFRFFGCGQDVAAGPPDRRE